MTSGLTDRELQIEALWDQGARINEIARQLRLSRRYVRLVATRIGLTDDDDGEAYALSMKLSSAALLKAMLREKLA